MSNFKIEFTTWFDNGVDTGRGNASRIIVTDTIEDARKISEAMLGEEVNASEYLEMAKVIGPTNEKADTYAWDPDRTWKRVMKNLNLNEEEITKVYNEKNKQVGLRFNLR